MATPCRKALTRDLQSPVPSLRLLAAAPSRRALSHLLCVQPDAAAPSRLGPGSRPRSAGSAAPTARRGKLSPHQSGLEDRPREQSSWLFFAEGWGELEPVLSFWIHTPLSLGERVARAPFPTARPLPLSGCQLPELGPQPPPFRAAQGPGSEPQSGGGSVRPAVPSHSRSRRCARAAHAGRQLRGSPAGSQEPEKDRPIPAPRAYLPVPANGLAVGALQPSFFPFARAAALLLPPAGWAPPPPLPDGLPACSSAAQRGMARPARPSLGSCEAGRGGGELAGSGRGAEGGGCERVAPAARSRGEFQAAGRGEK